MSKQLNIKKNTPNSLNTLWWKPVFSAHSEMNKSLKQVINSMVKPFGKEFENFWNTEDNIFDELQHNTHRVFSELFNNRQLVTPWLTGTMIEPYVDIIENGKSFKVHADVPGLNAKDLDVSVSDGAVTISGERCENSQQKDDTYIRRECHCGTFSRTIALPEEANVDKAKASFEHNVLIVEIPKKQFVQKKEQVRKLEIEHDDLSKESELKNKSQPVKEKPKKLQTQASVQPDMVSSKTVLSSSTSLSSNKKSNAIQDNKTKAS